MPISPERNICLERQASVSQCRSCVSVCQCWGDVTAEILIFTPQTLWARGESVCFLYCEACGHSGNVNIWSPSKWHAFNQDTFSYILMWNVCVCGKLDHLSVCCPPHSKFLPLTQFFLLIWKGEVWYIPHTIIHKDLQTEPVQRFGAWMVWTVWKMVSEKKSQIQTFNNFFSGKP